MFHSELGMALGSPESSYVARFPDAKTDHTSPLDVPSSGRMQALSPAIRVIILTESHGARDVLQKFGGLGGLAPFHGIIFDEAQMFGSPCFAILAKVLSPQAMHNHIGNPEQPALVLQPANSDLEKALNKVILDTVGKNCSLRGFQHFADPSKWLHTILLSLSQPTHRGSLPR